MTKHGKHIAEQHIHTIQYITKNRARKAEHGLQVTEICLTERGNEHDQSSNLQLTPTIAENTTTYLSYRVMVAPGPPPYDLFIYKAPTELCDLSSVCVCVLHQTVDPGSSGKTYTAAVELIATFGHSEEQVISRVRHQQEVRTAGVVA